MLNASQTKEKNCYMLFSSITDIQLNLYGRIKNMKPYDKNLHNKLFNIKANFERNAAQLDKMFEEGEVLQYYRLVNIIEKLIIAAENEENFSELLGLNESYLNKQITVINTHEELVEIAGKSGSGKLEVREEASHA